MSMRDLPSVTLDDVRVHLAANVESVAGISAARAAGAESIGLMRTEFLYLDRTDLPSEEEQYADAVSALRAADGIAVTFRTLDLGGDKLPAALRIADRRQPCAGHAVDALLARASRHFSHPAPRALPRVVSRADAAHVAAGLGRRPSSSARWQSATTYSSALAARGRRARTAGFSPARRHDRDAQRRLDRRPSGPALRFLSLGTNDLIQYAFAADRDNDDVAYLLPTVASRHAAAPEDGHRRGAPRLGSRSRSAATWRRHPMLTWILMGLGLRELSMDPSSIPLVKSVVRASNMAEAEALAAEALTLETEVKVGELVGRRMDRATPPEIAALAAG